jgi:hypothetical protein
VISEGIRAHNINYVPTVAPSQGNVLGARKDSLSFGRCRTTAS